MICICNDSMFSYKGGMQIYKMMINQTSALRLEIIWGRIANISVTTKAQIDRLTLNTATDSNPLDS